MTRARTSTSDNLRPGWGSALTTLAALVPAVGAIKADWNETHVHNPAWPPHAKFHNAQTITLAWLAAALSAAESWRPGALDGSRLRWATVCGGLFWLTQAPAAFFPGSAVVDPDNPTQPGRLGPLPINQVTATAAVVGPLLAAGYARETSRLRRGIR